MAIINAPAVFPSPAISHQKVWKKFFNRILRCYQRHRETTQCIKRIHAETLLLSQSLIKTMALAELGDFLSKGDQELYKATLFEQQGMKVSIQVLPANFEVPFHRHKNSINILLALSGELTVRRFTLSQSDKRYQEYQLKAGDANVGLCQLLNLHAIRADTSGAAFLSLHCQSENYTGCCYPFSWIRRALLCSSLFLAPATSACSNGYQPYADVIYAKQQLQQANRLREAINPASARKALTIYRLLEKDLPEAQYWLSVMYFQGLGTVPDEEQALGLAYEAARRGYQPAKEFHEHLMNGDFDPPDVC